MFRIAAGSAETAPQTLIEESLVGSYGYVIEAYHDDNGVITLVPFPKPKERVISEIPTLNHYMVPTTEPLVEKFCFLRGIIFDDTDGTDATSGTSEVSLVSLCQPSGAGVILPSKDVIVIDNFVDTFDTLGDIIDGDTVITPLEKHNFLFVGLPALYAVVDNDNLYHFKKPECVTCSDETFKGVLMLLLGNPRWAPLYFEELQEQQ